MGRLVVTRKSRQSIHLPEVNVRVTVISYDGRGVRLCIEAPKEITINREDRREEDGRREVPGKSA